MDYSLTPYRGSGSPYQAYFELAFQSADVAAFWWQPFLKGMGRSQLELAGLHSKNTRALLLWGRAVATSRSPADMVFANVALCESLAGHIGEALPRVSGALTQATQPPAGFELLTLPTRRNRDTLEIADTSEATDGVRERRRVA